MTTKTTRHTTRTSKPAKPARRDRKPPGTRKAPASPAKPSGAASALPAVPNWYKMNYDPIDCKDLRPGMAAMLWEVGKPGISREAILHRVMVNRQIDTTDPDQSDVFEIDMTTRDGKRTTIHARGSTLRAWRGTFK